MLSTDDLYTQLKEDIEKLAIPLFDVSEIFVKKKGMFLPHGAALLSNDEVEIVNFAPEGFETRKVSALEVLPGLHIALRETAKSKEVIAVAVAESVEITIERNKKSKAIKVLFEHQKGLTVALYLPWEKSIFGGFKLGEPITIDAEPEICAWH